MRISVTFKNLSASDQIKSYLQNKLDRFDKYLYSSGKADVVVKTEKLRKIVEINLLGDRLDIHAKKEHEDMQAAIDLALDRIRKQIVKNKEKLQQHRA
ncbi:MAG: ribosome-associated translation inhibitor RaiA [Desulfobacteraceae bacterium]|nr:ribosome-associated translation inhibitor RaiA [Desulfobacteraceae bacterium]